jgi:HK97 family phage major capsid protein
MIQDAKDDLEADKFTLGTGTFQPKGLITAATTTTTLTGAGFTIAHLYQMEESVPPRFRPRAQWIANRSIYNKIRVLDSAAGSGAQWIPSVQSGVNSGVPTPGNTGYTLIGYSANEASAMSSSVVAGQKVAVLGDPRYYVIVDRIGMDVELIPHLFGASNRFPTGQRGIYAFWRNHADVIDVNAFRVAVTV